MWGWTLKRERKPQGWEEACQGREKGDGTRGTEPEESASGGDHGVTGRCEEVGEENKQKPHFG